MPKKRIDNKNDIIWEWVASSAQDSKDRPEIAFSNSDRDIIKVIIVLNS